MVLSDSPERAPLPRPEHPRKAHNHVHRHHPPHPLPPQRPQTRPHRRRHRPPPHFEAELADRIAEWSTALNPTTNAQRFLVRRIALATLRMDECVAITAHIQHNHTHKSPELHALDRQLETQKLIKRFDADPSLTRLQLMRTYDGTLHLARRWRTLTQPEALPATPQAIEETLTLIANLLGIHPAHRDGSSQLLKLKKLFTQAIHQDATPDDREAAHRRLRTLARRQSKQLRHHAETHLKPLVDLETARIAAGLSLPMTTEARLARRYESAANREFDKSLALLKKLQANPTTSSTTAQIPTNTRCLATPHLADALPPPLDDLDNFDPDVPPSPPRKTPSSRPCAPTSTPCKPPPNQAAADPRPPAPPQHPHNPDNPTLSRPLRAPTPISPPPTPSLRHSEAPRTPRSPRSPTPSPTLSAKRICPIFLTARTPTASRPVGPPFAALASHRFSLQ